MRKSRVNGDADTNGNDEDESQTSSIQGNDPKSAWVQAVYEDDAGNEQKWKRTITTAGVSEYRINDRVVTAQQYNAALEEENILIKARNFLVFQGDVEAIATQKPHDLTRLIEQVSGSLEYKADYDRLKAESEEAGEQSSFHLNRRRIINAEIKQYEEQKREADKFKEKAEERDNAIVTHVLWKLFHLQRQIEASSAEIQKHQNELMKHRRGIANYEKNLDDAKKKYAEAGRAVGKVQKSIQAKDREIEEQQNSLLPINEQIAVSNKQLGNYSARIDTIDKERTSQADAVTQLERSLRTVERAQAQWQAEWDQNNSRQGAVLSDAELTEYTRLREEVNKRASADLARIERLKNDRAPVEATYNNLKNSIESQEYQLRSLERERTNIDGRKAEVAEIVTQTQSELDTKRQELSTLNSRRLQTARTRTELDEKLAEVARKLLEADDGRRASEKEIRMKETIATLKRTYPGVRGRVHELCKPKQKKFAEAVSTVLGRHFDAVVVDTEQTAKQCIEYLRDQRSGQATFIPLDTIQVKAVNTNLKGMDPGVRLAIDTIDFESAVSRAISYACGNAIVCDTLDLAKKMCYVKRVDAKAVTLDGTVIHKGGLMTGGRGKDQGSRRWDEAEVDKLNKLKDKLMSDFNALPQDRVHLSEEQALKNELSGLESRLRYAQEELDGLERNLDSKKRELDHVQSSLRQERPKRNEQQQKLEQLDGDIADYEAAVRTVEDEVFAAWCEQHNYDDVRDYEARQGGLQQEAAQKKLEFVTQKGRLEGQLSYERTRLQATTDRIQALRDKEQRDRNIIDELNNQKREIEDTLGSLEEELSDLNDELQQQQEAYKKASENLATHRSEVQKRSREVEHALKEISANEGEMQRHSSERYSILRRAKLDNIDIPVEEGSNTLDKLPINDIQDADAMDVDDDDDPTSSAMQAPQAADYGIQPDFDIIHEEELDQDSSPEMDQKLQDQIAKLNATLEKMQPNAHAEDRLVAANTRKADMDQEYRTADGAYKKLKEEFENVQTLRNDLFNKAFQHISDQIEPIYANLTKSAEFTAGGRAYLSADQEEPYLAGVNYHTMPPAKRFRDMEHLSGGEKTMAALALLFAIHSYQPSPFFVLDEVDAALDNANVAKLVNYVKQHCVSSAFPFPGSSSFMSTLYTEVGFQMLTILAL